MRDRLSFQRLPGFSQEDTVPDAKILCLFRQLTRHELVERLFNAFEEQLWTSDSVFSKGGQIIDASLVNVPRNRNKRGENRQIKEVKGWNEQPKMKRQKDQYARTSKKHGKSH